MMLSDKEMQETKDRIRRDLRELLTFSDKPKYGYIEATDVVALAFRDVSVDSKDEEMKSNCYRVSKVLRVLE